MGGFPGVSSRTPIFANLGRIVYVSGPASPPFPPAALALPLPVGLAARVSTPPLFQNGGCEAHPPPPFTWAPARPWPGPVSLWRLPFARCPADSPARVSAPVAGLGETQVTACDAVSLIKGALGVLFFPRCAFSKYFYHVRVAYTRALVWRCSQREMFVPSLPN